jgi:hypothetical protein
LYKKQVLGPVPASLFFLITKFELMVWVPGNVPMLGFYIFDLGLEYWK